MCICMFDNITIHLVPIYNYILSIYLTYRSKLYTGPLCDDRRIHRHWYRIVEKSLIRMARIKERANIGQARSAPIMCVYATGWLNE